MSKSFQPLQIPDPVGGWKPDIPAHKLSPEFWTVFENVRTYNGRIEKQRGWRTQGSSATGVPGLVTRARFQNGDDFPIVATDQNIYRVESNGNLTLLQGGFAANTIARWEHTSFPNANFFNRTDGAIEIKQYDGTNLDGIAFFGTLFLDGTNTITPLGRTITQFQSHLLIGALLNEGAGNIDLQSVAGSDLADGVSPEGQFDWAFFDTASDAIILDVFEGNDEVQKIIRLSDWLVVVKEGSLHMLQYEGLPLVYRKQQPVSFIGTPCPHSVIGVRGLIYFIGQNNIYVFDGVNATSIADGVYWTFVSQIMPDDPRSLWAFDDVLRKEINWVGRDNKALVYNYENKAFSIKKFPFTAGGYVNLTQISDDWASQTQDWDAWLADWREQTALAGVNDLTILLGKSDGELHVMGESSEMTDAGTDITSVTESPDFDFGNEHMLKTVNELRSEGVVTGTNGLELYVGTRDNLGADIEWNNTPYTFVSGRATFVRTARWFRFKFVKRGGYYTQERYTPYYRMRGFF